METQSSVQQKELRFILILGALFAVPLVIAGFLQLSSHAPPGRAGGSMMLVQSQDGRRAPGVASAAAVDSAQINQRLLAASATTGGDVEVSLAWNGTSDLDLEVRDPSGEVINAEHPHSTSGGVQDVDANPTWLTAEGDQRQRSGQIPGQETVREVPEFLFDLDKQAGLPQGFTLPGDQGKAATKFSHTPVEHIYFTHAPAGTYTVYAHCYSWRERSLTPLPCTVQVRTHGKVFHEVSGALGPASFVANGIAPIQACQFVIR
jgi:hypothetical protein